MIEFTAKEIETAGYNRYMRAKRRLFWTMVILAVGLGVSLLLIGVLPKEMNHYTKAIVEIIPTLASFAYYYKVVFVDAAKAGKTFRKQWDKERQPK